MRRAELEDKDFRREARIALERFEFASKLRAVNLPELQALLKRMYEFGYEDGLICAVDEHKADRPTCEWLREVEGR